MSESLHPLQINPPLQHDICSRLTLEESEQLLIALKIKRLMCPFPFTDPKTGQNLILPEISQDSITVYQNILINGVNKTFFDAIINGKEGVIAILMQMVTDFDIANQYGKTLLDLAILNNRELLVRKILDEGVSNSTKSKALFAAIDNKNIQIVKWLIEAGADVNTIFSIGWTPLMIAAQEGQSEIISLLLNNPNQRVDVNFADEYGTNALGLAAGSGSVPTIQLLLEAGANINDQMTTLLIKAAGNKHGEDMVKFLLSFATKDDINRAISGRTALYSAVFSGNKGIVEALLKAGANPKISRGQSLLNLANDRREFEIADLLMKYGG